MSIKCFHTWVSVYDVFVLFLYYFIDLLYICIYLYLSFTSYVMVCIYI